MENIGFQSQERAGGKFTQFQEYKIEGARDGMSKVICRGNRVGQSRERRLRSWNK